MSLEFKDIWNTLSKLNVNEHTDKKGNLTYLSWSWAWAELMKYYPEATYSFEAPVSFEGGTMEVWCTITIGNHSRTMWLPVIDYKNKSISNPDSMAINTARMRCLVKCMAMFGLGHYIYAGEDLPEESFEPSDAQKQRFIKYVEAKDALRLFLFAKSLDEKTYTSLYNSFPDGKKVAMKKECSDLEMTGSAIAREIVETVTEQVKNNDPAYVENLEGLADDEKKVLASMFNKDTLDKIKEMRKGESK